MYDEIKQSEPQKGEKGTGGQECTGTVKTILTNKGYGFVRQDGGMKDVFVKLGDLGLKEGMKVRYKLGRHDGRDCAVDVEIEKEAELEPEPEPEIEEAQEESSVFIDLWGRKHAVNKAEKHQWEQAPSWDADLVHGTELLRGRQLAMEDYAKREQLGSLGSMFAMFDGHGGKECSEFCFNKIGQFLEAEFRKKFPVDDIKAKKLNPFGDTDVTDFITKGFSAADKTFLEQTSESNGREGCRAGSTAVMSIIRGPSRDKLQIITANVGDSRAVMCRGGKAVRLSEDHKPNRRDEKKRIEEDGGSVLLVGESWRCTYGKGWGDSRFNMPHHQVMLATSRALGDRELKESRVVSSVPEFTKHNLGREDFFIILASDGVWDVISDQEACDLAIAHFGDPKKMASVVAQTAIEKESHDNTSAMVVQFGWNADRVKKCAKEKDAKKAKLAAKNVDMFASSDDD